MGSSTSREGQYAVLERGNGQIIQDDIGLVWKPIANLQPRATLHIRSNSLMTMPIIWEAMPSKTQEEFKNFWAYFFATYLYPLNDSLTELQVPDARARRVLLFSALNQIATELRSLNYVSGEMAVGPIVLGHGNECNCGCRTLLLLICADQLDLLPDESPDGYVTCAECPKHLFVCDVNPREPVFDLRYRILEGTLEDACILLPAKVFPQMMKEGGVFVASNRQEIVALLTATYARRFIELASQKFASEEVIGKKVIGNIYKRYESIVQQYNDDRLLQWFRFEVADRLAFEELIDLAQRPWTRENSGTYQSLLRTLTAYLASPIATIEHRNDAARLEDIIRNKTTYSDAESQWYTVILAMCQSIRQGQPVIQVFESIAKQYLQTGSYESKYAIYALLDTHRHLEIRLAPLWLLLTSVFAKATQQQLSRNESDSRLDPLWEFLDGLFFVAEVPTSVPSADEIAAESLRLSRVQDVPTGLPLSVFNSCLGELLLL